MPGRSTCIRSVRLGIAFLQGVRNGLNWLHDVAFQPAGSSFMTVSVRPMVPEDASEVARMAAALSAHEGQPPPPFDAGTIMRWGFGPGRRFERLVAVADGRTAGYQLVPDGFPGGRSDDRTVGKDVVGLGI